MVGNPIAIGAGNFRPTLTNYATPYHRIRSNRIRIIGAPATLRRRTLAGTLTKKGKWVVNCVASATFANGYPEYDRLLPCPPSNHSNHPPRVEHLVVLEEGPVCDYISRTLNLPPLYVADLIHFGAVYYALVHPEPPATATPEQVQVYEKFTSPHLLKQRQSLEEKTVSEAQKTFRITHVNENVEVGTYLRVYVHPRRFPRCYEIDWKSRIIAIDDNYVILDKPAGTSVGGTSNNIEESCANFATRALGLTSPLLTTHQIDNCTEGCVLMARTEEYSSIFHEKFREKKVKKLYLALVAAPISCGIITHYMQPAKLAPRIVSEEYDKGWQLCQLEVLDCKEVPWPNSTIEEKYQIKDCGWPVKTFAYECKINLLTGRTHQIRAQLAACGAPLIGDSMYMPAALAELTKPGVSPFGKYKREYSCEGERRIAIENWNSLHGKEPSLAIGLQACQISWDDGEQVYEAGSPWWR
ncbi:RNA pseudouridine synthase 6, chloroplastic-like isoform X1 [Chenopodium quinoa]|uniref:RNA pseudouridine synthase 6, chloroplastic-like isoform X1 n=1 Tax=Chenopodium quinoa TaxID=63459 RepID=UPI000B785393|nr:RNA pseudouridine synthase 6, chloroplastic-like isoform X1 [Chenopodium quinoa]